MILIYMVTLRISCLIASHGVTEYTECIHIHVHWCEIWENNRMFDTYLVRTMLFPIHSNVNIENLKVKKSGLMYILTP